MTKNKLHSKLFALLTFYVLISTSAATAQVYTNKVAGKKNISLEDSLKNSTYPYALPIWGEKATKKGFQLPYSAGVSVQYFGQESDITISNLEVGFNNGPMYNIDQLVQFNKATSRASAITARPDVWLFPFLNVYGILGVADASTDIGYGIYLPDSAGNSTNIANGATTVNFTTSTFGIGMTPTMGVAGCFVVLDMNYTWTAVPQLNKPARTFVFGPRVGKTFNFKNKKSAISAWVGGFSVHLNSVTTGSLPLNEAIDFNGIDGKIDNANEQISSLQQGVDAWWTGLTSLQQSNPVNIAKYNQANNLLETAGTLVSQIETGVNNAENSTVQYSMDKKPTNMWNFLIGAQYQYNRHWMLRAEIGIFGTRSQITTGIQYRFGL
jgi:hypothetical protein